VPKLSIGLPAYNGAQLLPQVLDCFPGQAFKDFEIVRGDNESTNRTPWICRPPVALPP
jgi:glycosyltransferase involved in cell wall biosynthesis